MKKIIVAVAVAVVLAAPAISAYWEPCSFWPYCDIYDSRAPR